LGRFFAFYLAARATVAHDGAVQWSLAITTVMDCLRRIPDALALRDLLSRSGVHPPA
jgi:hypothetical protein